MKSHLVSFGNYLFNRYNVKVHSGDGNNVPLYERTVSDADLSNWEAENPALQGKAHTDYPSRYEIGEKVKLFLMPEGEESFPGLNAKILAVHFTNSTIKYDLEIKFAGEYTTRVYNIESIFVKDLDYGVAAPVIDPMKAYGKPERALDHPVKYSLTDCLRELKWGRPALGQELIEKWIAELHNINGDQERVTSVVPKDEE
jgi:hypothetical protein